MAKPFASTKDVNDQRPVMTELGKNVYGYLSDFDPNTGVIVGSEFCTVIDCRATPALAREFIEDIRKITDKPIKYIFLTHYHAVRVFGAAAFGDVGIIASSRTRDLIVERGDADWKSEMERFPRLFKGAHEIPGLTWPAFTFEEHLTQWMGEQEVQFQWLGRGHTAGDSVCYLPRQGVVFTGDLVDFHSTSYTGDAYIRDWIGTLERLRALGATTLVPGRGRAATGAAEVNSAIDQTKDFLTTLIDSTEAATKKKSWDLKAVFDIVYPIMKDRYGDWPLFDHCVTFGINRAYDEVRGVADPAIWTAERDKALWDAMHA